MEKLTKAMIKACGSLANYKVSKEDVANGYNGRTYTDANAFYVCGKFGAVRFVNLDADSQNAVEEIVGNKKEMRLEGMFEQAFQKDKYPDEFCGQDYYEFINLADMQKEISARKKTDEYKQMGNKVVIGNWNNHSKYNMELMLKAAKCIGKKQVIAHYPKYKNQPIILVGDEGNTNMMALVLPIRW